MPATEQTMLRKIVSRLGGLALSHALPDVQRASRQLARAMRFVVLTDSKGALFIPHYWAIYVHDGRGSFGPGSKATPGKKARFLVWFRDPHDDPRLQHAMQVQRRVNVRRLTKDQFKFWLKQNKFARDRGLPEPMVVHGWPNRPGAKVGPTPGKFFFGNEPGQGMAGFMQGIARHEAKQIVQEDMREILGKQFFEQATEKIGLRF